MELWQYNPAKFPYTFVRTRTSGTKIPMHTHKCCEFVYFLSGSGTLEYDDTVFEFSAGSYYYMEPNKLHSEIYHQTGKSLVVWYPFPFELGLKSIAQNDSILNLYKISEYIRAEHKTQLDNSDTMINALITEIMILLDRQQSLKKHNTEYLIHNAIAYINEYYMTSLKIDDLAAECNYSPGHFRVLFRNITGQNPKDYILNKRIALAKKQLKQTQLSIEKICENCGFNFYSQFMSQFKTKTGYSPSDYRKRFG